MAFKNGRIGEELSLCAILFFTPLGVTSMGRPPIDPHLVERLIRIAKSLGIKHAARMLGVDRNTIRKYLRRREPHKPNQEGP